MLTCPPELLAFSQQMDIKLYAFTSVKSLWEYVLGCGFLMGFFSLWYSFVALFVFYLPFQYNMLQHLFGIWEFFCGYVRFCRYSQVLTAVEWNHSVFIWVLLVSLMKLSNRIWTKTSFFSKNMYRSKKRRKQQKKWFSNNAGSQWNFASGYWRGLTILI